jgi:hypothetical protein
MVTNIINKIPIEVGFLGRGIRFFSDDASMMLRFIFDSSGAGRSSNLFSLHRLGYQTNKSISK